MRAVAVCACRGGRPSCCCSCCFHFFTLWSWDLSLLLLLLLPTSEPHLSLLLLRLPLLYPLVMGLSLMACLEANGGVFGAAVTPSSFIDVARM